VYCEHQRFEVGKFHDAKKTLQQSRVIDPEINAVCGKLLQEVFFRLGDAGRQFFTLNIQGCTCVQRAKSSFFPQTEKGIPNHCPTCRPN
jgi:hypothetical protein